MIITEIYLSKKLVNDNYQLLFSVLFKKLKEKKSYGIWT